MSRLLLVLVPIALALMAAANTRAPIPKTDLLPGERDVEFEYVIEGERKKGSCRVLTLDIGGDEKMELVRIPKGKFKMGSPKGEKDRNDDEDQHDVEITKDFYIGRYPVTQVQYRVVIGGSPSRFKGDRLPVEALTWDDAKAYCGVLSKKLGRKLSLPSEAQWEYACRAGTRTPFHFGSKLNGDLANCDGNQPYGTETKGPFEMKTTAVGSFPANPWGLYDMSGNVWQWCEDWYGPYSSLDSSRDPVQSNKLSDELKAFRGGSWHEPARTSRSASRFREKPGYHLSDVGFRVHLSLEN